MHAVFLLLNANGIPPGKLGPSGQDGDGEDGHEDGGEDDDEQKVPVVPAEGRKKICMPLHTCMYMMIHELGANT